MWPSSKELTSNLHDTSVALCALALAPALIDRATAALDCARTNSEVLEARDMARVAYDAAKSATRMHRAKQAHDRLLPDVHRSSDIPVCSSIFLRIRPRAKADRMSRLNPPTIFTPFADRPIA